MRRDGRTPSRAAMAGLEVHRQVPVETTDRCPSRPRGNTFPAPAESAGVEWIADEERALAQCRGARDARLVAGAQGDAGERAVGLQTHVIRSGRCGDGAGLGIAAAVWAAGVSRVGRCTAGAHIQVGIAAAAAGGHRQGAAAGRHGDGVVLFRASRCAQAGHRSAVGQGVSTTATAAAPAIDGRSDRGIGVDDAGTAAARAGAR